MGESSDELHQSAHDQLVFTLHREHADDGDHRPIGQRAIRNTLDDSQVRGSLMLFQLGEQGLEGAFRVVGWARKHAVLLLHPQEEKGIRIQRWLQSAFRHWWPRGSKRQRAGTTSGNCIPSASEAPPSWIIRQEAVTHDGPHSPRLPIAPDESQQRLVTTGSESFGLGNPAGRRNRREQRGLSGWMGTGFDLESEEWNYTASREPTAGPPAMIPTSIRKAVVSCPCGHSWSAFEGRGAGRIETVKGFVRVVCPDCGAVGSIPIPDPPRSESVLKSAFRPNLALLVKIKRDGRLRQSKESDDSLHFEVFVRQVRTHVRAGYVTLVTERRDAAGDVHTIECELTALGQSELQRAGL